MFMIIFKAWWMVALLPLTIFEEVTDMFAKFLKRKNIYAHWDFWHSLLVVLVILLIALEINGSEL